MALREIRTKGDPILRKVCKPVEAVDDHIRQILQDMAETMYSTPNGGGLAAPQIGILRRMIVADMGHGLLKLVNPEIIKQSGRQREIEGCLSFPGVWGRVKRPARVTVRALDETGKEVEIKAEGPLAKCLCHEIDHLNGVLFIDKVTEFVTLK